MHLAALGLRWVPVVNPARALALPLTLQGGAVVQHALTTGLGSVNCGKDEGEATAAPRRIPVHVLEQS